MKFKFNITIINGHTISHCSLSRFKSHWRGRIYVLEVPHTLVRILEKIVLLQKVGSSSLELGLHWYPPPSFNLGQRLIRNTSQLQSASSNTIFFSPNPALTSSSFSHAVVGISYLARHTNRCVHDVFLFGFFDCGKSFFTSSDGEGLLASPDPFLRHLYLQYLVGF